MTGSIKRTPRDAETRAKTQRRKPWAPPSKLEAPEAPAGYKHRWIRTAIRGEDDKMNVNAKFREGWEPVRAEDHPELMLESDIGSQFKGNIEVGGLLLCKAPEELMAARTKHFQDIASNQMSSVDNNYLRESDPRMPMLNPERSTRTTFGRN